MYLSILVLSIKLISSFVYESIKVPSSSNNSIVLSESGGVKGLLIGSFGLLKNGVNGPMKSGSPGCGTFDVDKSTVSVFTALESSFKSGVKNLLESYFPLYFSESDFCGPLKLYSFYHSYTHTPKIIPAIARTKPATQNNFTISLSNQPNFSK